MIKAYCEIIDDPIYLSIYLVKLCEDREEASIALIHRH